MEKKKNQNLIANVVSICIEMGSKKRVNTQLSPCQGYNQPTLVEQE